MIAVVLAAAVFSGCLIPWAIRCDQEQPVSHTGKARKWPI